MPRSRSRRLRKKLHVGEFQQFGFEVKFKLSGDPAADQCKEFWDAFILEAVEANQLTYGGGEGGFVVPDGRASATELHQQVIRSWLRARPEILSAEVGPLVDAWCPDGL